MAERPGLVQAQWTWVVERSRARAEWTDSAGIRYIQLMDAEEDFEGLLEGSLEAAGKTFAIGDRVRISGTMAPMATCAGLVLVAKDVIVLERGPNPPASGPQVPGG